MVIDMIKVQNGIASRTELPAFLQGLAPESLLNLTWTDPMLDVRDCAWFPEESDFQSLQKFEKYGDEVFTIDSERKVVVVTRPIVSMSQDEINAITTQEAEQKQQRIDEITAQITSLQTQLAQLTQE
jgi:hypothetical protein